MNLAELNPKWEEKDGVNTHVSFDCPKCQAHRIIIPIPPTEKAWDMVGDEFSDLSLHPSIAHDNGVGCRTHFFITNGEIINA